MPPASVFKSRDTVPVTLNVRSNPRSVLCAAQVVAPVPRNRGAHTKAFVWIAPSYEIYAFQRCEFPVLKPKKINFNPLWRLAARHAFTEATAMGSWCAEPWHIPYDSIANAR
jgi:hypothetical protein